MRASARAMLRALDARAALLAPSTAAAACAALAPRALGATAAPRPAVALLHTSRPPFVAPSPPSLASTEVRLPPLGESISEGAIAAVLVAPGQAVAEDAVLVQVETDKVTVDVRAPAAGVVASVLVAEGESVVVGQLVVVLEEGAVDGVVAAAPTQAAAAPPPPSPPQAVAAVASTPAPRPAPPTAPSNARRPSIRFPRRMSAAGVRVSSLPASAQAAARGEGDDENLLVRLSGGRLYVGRERGTKLSQSRVLTDAEIDQIELGGAV